MPRHQFALSGYKAMWLFAMFDLPVDKPELHRKVHALLPSHGQVRLVSVTDRQFEKMETYVGKKRRPVEDPPMQLMLF